MENLLKRIIKSIKVNENTVSLLLGVVIVIVVGGMIYNYFQDTPAQLPVIEDTKINEIISDFNSTESANLNNEIASNNLSITPTVKLNPTNTPTILPTSTPVPTKIPTPTLTPTPTNIPTQIPSPTMIPTVLPTATVIPTSTVAPTKVPTVTEVVQVTTTPTPTKFQGQIASGVSTDTNLNVTNDNSNNANKYVVVKGDNLWRIAEKKYNSGYAWTEIAKVNKLNRNQVGVLMVGQELVLPEVTKEYAKTTTSDKTIASIIAVNQITGDSYVVVKGDNLWNIAVRAYGNGFQWVKIVEANKEVITNPRYIEVGMSLKIVRD